MNADRLAALVRLYPEWHEDLDETGCPDGWVTCRICDGGGSTDGRLRTPPKHRPGCLRAEFEAADRESQTGVLERCAASA